jgi:hypothetical protein
MPGACGGTQISRFWMIPDVISAWATTAPNGGYRVSHNLGAVTVGNKASV